MDAGNLQVYADDGFFFGIGAFETIAVENGRAVMHGAHLDRLRDAACFLGFELDEGRIAAETQRVLADLGARGGRWAMKIAASPLNTVVTTRRNPYGRETYERGFACTASPVVRNETSPLVHYKTFNYGDLLIEKRRSALAGFDEPVLFNSKGLLAEGATTNVFLVIDGAIVTPRVECGALPGILRAWVLAHAHVEERDVTAKDIAGAEEMFLTNSLLGIMPVARMDGRAFPSRGKARELLVEYLAFAHAEL